jgi:hypothetical protein
MIRVGETVVNRPPDTEPKTGNRPGRKATSKQGVNPLLGVARFTVVGPVRGYNLKVGHVRRLDAAADEDAELTERALNALLGKRFITFKGGKLASDTNPIAEPARFDTRDPDLIAWLRYRLRPEHPHRLKRVKEEISMRDLSCPTCGETVKAASMGAHILMHQETGSLDA